MNPDENISLKEYIHALRDADTRTQDLLKRDLDHRLDEMNRFREQIREERSNYVLLDVYNERHNALIQREEADVKELSLRIAAIEVWRANLMGRLVVFSILGSLIIGTAAALVTHLLS